VFLSYFFRGERFEKLASIENLAGIKRTLAGIGELGREMRPLEVGE